MLSFDNMLILPLSSFYFTWIPFTRDKKYFWLEVMLLAMIRSCFIVWLYYKDGSVPYHHPYKMWTHMIANKWVASCSQSQIPLHPAQSVGELQEVLLYCKWVSLIGGHSCNRWAFYLPTWFLGHVLSPEAKVAEKRIATFCRRFLDSAPWVNVLQSQTAQEGQQGCSFLQQIHVGLIYL